MKECDTMININDETISQYLEFKLNKENSYFTKEELNSIKEIVINPIDLSGNERSVNLDYIKELPSLEKLDVLNMHVNQNNIQDITKLTKLTSLTFNNCELETPELISNLKLKNLSIINCKLKNSSFPNTYWTGSSAEIRRAYSNAKRLWFFVIKTSLSNKI